LVCASQALMTLTDTDQVLAAVADSAIELFAAEACSLSLYDRASDELVFFLSQGAASVPPFRMPAGRGIAGHVFQTGETFSSNDVPNEKRFFRVVDATSGHQTRSMICCPIAKRGDRLGTIQVINTRLPDGFTADHTKLLEVLAGMVGATISRTRTEQAVRDSQALLRDETETRYRLVQGRNSEMASQLLTLKRAAQSRATVLLLGESGVGKEVAARAIHQWSERADKPFVVINCVALSPTLLESELFGHEKGAFTGAHARKRGKFEFAAGGTLFLDEIGELPIELQAKLLRVLQDGEIQRVGGNETIKPDVRLLAATNRDLKQAIDEGRFRRDLFYRLNVISVTLPPLRERPEDVAELAQHFLQRACVEQKRKLLGIGEQAMERLCAYAWPGNVRELANVIERAVVLCPDDEISLQDLPEEVREGAPRSLPPLAAASNDADDVEGSEEGSLADIVTHAKRRAIEHALTRCDGNQARAAKLLGIHPSNLSRMARQLGIR